MSTQQEWADAVMQGFDGMQRAGMSDALEQKLMTGVKMNGKRNARVPVATFWAMAAGLALLIGVNIFSVLRHSQSGNNTTEVASNSRAFASEYFGSVTNY